MKKPLVIISACQFTRLALESLIPADRYIVRVYSNVTTEVEFVLKTSCGYLLADIPSLPSGELVLLACLVRLRSDAGQWQVCLTGDSDWFDNAPASSLYNGFPHIGTLLKASRYQNQIIRWLLRPLPGDMSDFWLLTARELSVLKILMQGMSFSEIARYEQRSSKTLHAIATQALRKLGLGTLSDFRLLYTGCGDSRVKRNIRLHARYVGQHSAHRLTQYVQNMVSGILYPEKVIVGKSINSKVIPYAGNVVTSDIAYAFGTPPSDAEAIKVRHGCALGSIVGKDESVEVPSVGGRPPRSLQRQTLSSTDAHTHNAPPAIKVNAGYKESIGGAKNFNNKILKHIKSYLIMLSAFVIGAHPLLANNSDRLRNITLSHLHFGTRRGRRYAVIIFAIIWSCG